MKTRLGWLVASGLILTLLASCKFETSATPATQLVVDIDAEPFIRERLSQLEIVVTAARHRDNIDEREKTFEQLLEPNENEEASAWPVRLVLTPREADPRRVFELTATARDDDGNLVARARIVTGYVSHQIRYTRLVLEAECYETECGDLETCRVGGCTDAFVEPSDLPLLPGPDAAEGGAGDTGPGDPDTGVDTGVDAGPDAGPDAGDSGPPPLDPCLTNNGGCDALVTCRTIDDVPTCGQCPNGFVDVNGNGSRCEDIDECKEDNGGCDRDHGECTNTPGGFDCRCAPGYNGDGRTCAVNVPCGDDPAVCDSLATCQEIGDQRVCQCNAGYEGNGAQCSDIDECVRNLDDCPNHSECTNNDGSFSCACVAGYMMMGDACVDIDECATMADNCDDMPDACRNVDGTFMCQCPPGYEGSGVGDTCVDIDECATMADNCDDMPEACLNTVGSYECMCPAGYLGTGRSANGCLEVDECLLDLDACDDEPNACINEIGGNPGYRCDCPDGYDGDGQGNNGCSDINQCTADTDDCDDMPNACVNVIGGLPGYTCMCPAGYRGTTATGANGCTDIDECAENMDDCDDAPNACRNTVGGFECDCPDGYSGNGRGANGCSDEDECAMGTDNCDNDPNACENRTPGFVCMCPTGYTGNGEGQDGCGLVNECSSPTMNNCDTSPGACVEQVPMNGGPGYRCQCPAGYTGNGVGADGCTDVDECMSSSMPDDCNANADCNGTTPAGSFTCTCRAGYTGNGKGPAGCGDIDECMMNTDGCDDDPNACMNMSGTFRCQCPSGFTGDGIGANGCMNEDACAANPCLNGAACVDQPGGAPTPFTCTCTCGFMGATCNMAVSTSPLGASGTGNSSGFTGDDIIAAVPIDIGEARTLVGFRVGNPSGSARVRLGLYSDSNNSPGAKVAESAVVTLSGDPIPLLGNPTSCAAIAPGVYWIAIQGDASFGVGLAAGVGPQGQSFNRYSSAATFNDQEMLPGTFPSPTADLGATQTLAVQLLVTP